MSNQKKTNRPLMQNTKLLRSGENTTCPETRELLNGVSTGDDLVWNVPQRLGLAADIRHLRNVLLRWVEECDPEVRQTVRHQLIGRAKYYRPVTIFACHRAVSNRQPSARLFSSAAALELIHNVSLIIDDILDRSRYRRGKLSLHCRFGSLPALMTAGYINAAVFKLVADDAYSVRLLADLTQRLGAAECLQWRLRRHPLGVEDWRMIAGEDTGVMFETCAQLGTRDECLRKFGHLLGVLYHGCDDVADVRGTSALGGGKEQDIADGILTLPAAIATRDHKTAVLFRSKSRGTIKALTERLVLALPEAEDYLDKIAAEAEAEALAHAKFPERLVALVHDTRALSKG
jgi:geranylgeranyl pyrophosphate synthase